MADDNAGMGPVDADNQMLPASLQANDDPDLLDCLQQWYRQDRDHSHEWRVEARENYDIVAGKQWSDEELSILREGLRAPVTFNRVAPMVKIVSGLEVSNRQEVRYIPRQPGQGVIDDLLTGAAKWIRDECDAEDEESDAFLDCVVTGMGWAETRLRYDKDPDGELEINRVDPLEMYWDCSATKKNLSDARRLFRVRDVPIGEAEEMFPDASLSELDARWANDLAASSREPHDADAAPFYRIDQSGKGGDRERRQVRMVEAQWWVYETTWRVLDPFTGQEVSMNGKDYRQFESRLIQMGHGAPIAVKQRTRAYWRAIVGSIILQTWRGPAKGGFTYKSITGDRDRNNGTWYGIVRAMKDPQRWANKWLVQSLHILNTGAKGGIIAERDAFEDTRDAEEHWAEPDAIVWAQPGAIAGNKLMPRPPNPMPQGLPDLLTLAISSMRDCTGINLELLGLIEKEQSGVLEHMRKQAGMTVLASLFDSLRRYRKEQGRLMLWYIVTFLSDGRLIKIGGSQDAQYIPLLRRPDTVEYDVVVDDTPNSPNLKERTWNVLIQMLPFLSRVQVPPQIYLELLKYSPLPETVTEKISQIVSAQPQQPSPQAVAMQSRAQVDAARARQLDAQTQSIGMEQQAKVSKYQADMAKTQADMASSAAEMHRTQADAQTSAAQIMIETELARAKIENLRAAAVANLAKAGIAQQSASADNYLAVLEMLDRVVGWRQQETQLHQQQQQIDNPPQRFAAA